MEKPRSFGDFTLPESFAIQAGDITCKVDSMRKTVQKIIGISLGAMAVAAGPFAQAADPSHGRDLVIEVRDTPPEAQGGFDRGADNSYTVSTGSSGDRDRNESETGTNPGYTLATSNSTRVVHVREGERVRVDLPAVQSLQFHVPVPGAGAKGANASTSTAVPAAQSNSPASGASSRQGANQTPSATGVVYFEAVSAFAARFRVQGAQVRVDLAPLATGGVAAPFAAVDGGARRPVFVAGHLGEWIPLGDTEMSVPTKSLTLTAEAPSPASVWVRVTLP